MRNSCWSIVVSCFFILQKGISPEWERKYFACCYRRVQEECKLQCRYNLYNDSNDSHPQTFTEADKRQWLSMEGEWEKEKEKILNSLLGSGQDFLELPSQNEVHVLMSCDLNLHVSCDAYTCTSWFVLHVHVPVCMSVIWYVCVLCSSIYSFI